MSIPKWWLGCLLSILWIGAAVAQTNWPDIMPNLRAGSPVSPVAVALPYTTVEQPAPAVPADKARWSGKWAGYACKDRVCDTKLIVEKVTVEGATIVYAFASADVKPPYSIRVEAKFVSDELQATLPDGSKVAYRMRKEGDVEFLFRREPRWAAGILTREN
jgi:hypothetical protein